MKLDQSPRGTSYREAAMSVGNGKNNRPHVKIGSKPRSAQSIIVLSIYYRMELHAFPVVVLFAIKISTISNTFSKKIR